MDSKEYREQIEHFMEEKGLKSGIFELFETEIVRKKIKDKYDFYSSQMQRCIEKAPEQQAENAEVLKESMKEYTYDQFLDDIRVTFMAKQYKALNVTFILFNGYTDFHAQIIEEIKKTFNPDNTSALKDIEECTNECLNELLQTCLEILYENYIPKDVPEELIPLLSMLLGQNFTIVSENAIFYETDTAVSEESCEGDISESTEE
ncbi:MAG: hypothetical protein IJB90_00405 [Clostridia bacterium]|nr:hypothetical protein [Clostridia bacterium]